MRSHIKLQTLTNLKFRLQGGIRFKVTDDTVGPKLRKFGMHWHQSCCGVRKLYRPQWCMEKNWDPASLPSGSSPYKPTLLWLLPYTLNKQNRDSGFSCMLTTAPTSVWCLLFQQSSPFLKSAGSLVLSSQEELRDLIVSPVRAAGSPVGYLLSLLYRFRSHSLTPNFSVFWGFFWK